MKNTLLYISYLLLLLFTACQADENTTQEQALEALGAVADDYKESRYRWGFMDQQGKIVILDRFDEVRPFSDSLALVRLSGRWGYIDHAGEWVVENKYRAAWPFEQAIARVQNDEGLFGFIKKDGTMLIDFQWQEASDFHEGLAVVRKEQLYGCIDTSGQLLIAADYERISRFKNGLAIAKKNGRYGMIDQTGNTKLAFEFDQLKAYHNHYARAKANGLYGYLDQKGQWVIAPQFVQALDFNNGYAPAFDGQHWGLINEQGQWHLAAQYNQLSWSGLDHRWIAENNQLYTLIDAAGTERSQAYDEIQGYQEARATYRVGELWGYLNTEGQAATPAGYYLAWPYKNGIARVATANGLSYIDLNGELILPPSLYLYEIRDYTEGLAAVQIYRQ